MNLSMGLHTDGQASDVHYRELPQTPDYEVQIFLGGSSYHTMYMSVEEARAFAYRILQVLPASVRVGEGA